MVKSDDKVIEKLAQIFQVLSDQTRLKVIRTLEKQELCVSEIMERTGASQSAISHQLMILRQMDLVRSQRRGKNIYYRIADGHVFSLIKNGLDHVMEKG